MMLTPLKICAILLLCLLHALAKSQCAFSINTFPHVENFEIGQGNWSSGGTNSSWVYGVPSKQVIGNAGSGIKCWMIGGLQSGSYNNGEKSWLQSPCYDFSTLTNPQISFKVFWETEKKYDGASFQYSLDSAVTWHTLGTTNDNNTCDGANWFNTSTINSLGFDGWSGNVQPTSPCAGGAGNGSGSWVTARHSLTALAGKKVVLFRFVFAAGTQCNNYDGFAVDDITVSETPAGTADFVFFCSGGNLVNFTSTSSLCATSYYWTFGEAASPNNTSTSENPTHIYLSSGNYIVTLVVNFPGAVVATKTKTITVLNVQPVVVTPIACNGDSNGALTVNASGGSGYNYLWSTNPPQNTQSVNNLPAGQYAVLISSANACATIASVNLPQPTVLATTFQTNNAFCGNNNGRVEILATGGVPPYQYTWSNGATVQQQNNLPPNSYAVLVKDANNCNRQLTNIIVKDSIKQLALNLGKDTSFCPGNQAILNAGSFVSYHWQDNSTQPTYTVTQTGSYFVKVMDGDGCIKSDTININVDCSDIYFPSAFTPNNDTKNDKFGPIGNLYSITKFDMRVYGRWGQLIFSTTNPFDKWDGKQKGTDLDTGVYVWMATYSLNNGPSVFKKGTVTIIR